jgi:hypothetical protein
MSNEALAPQSRRAILTAGLGAVAATVAGAFVRPASVAAAGDDGAPVVVGGFYSDVRSQMTLGNQSNGEIVLWCASNAGSGTGNGTGIGVVGYSAQNIGVQGQSDGYAGVKALGSFRGLRADALYFGVESYATGSGGVGVYGNGQTGVVAAGQQVGVEATAASPSATAVLGTASTGVVGQSNANSTGVMGVSGPTLPAAQVKTGVFGYATQDATSRGVYGVSTSGRGVTGSATSGIGVRAAANNGTAVYATAGSGYALRTDGKVRFDKSGGIATIAAGTSSILVTPGIDLATTTAVVATLQGSAGGTTNVHRVVIDATANTFRIYLTANATASVKVGWFAFG